MKRFNIIWNENGSHLRKTVDAETIILDGYWWKLDCFIYNENQIYIDIEPLWAVCEIETGWCIAKHLIKTKAIELSQNRIRHFDKENVYVALLHVIIETKRNLPNIKEI